MSKPFELVHDMEVPASAEEVWDALTVGPQLDSWFMGRNEVEPGEGGVIRTEGPGWTEEAGILAWEPPVHLAYRTEIPNGRQNGFDWRIEDRGPGRAAVRWTHTGVIPGDWEAEYEAMSEGDPAYFFKLKQYLTHFAGRTGFGVEVVRPGPEDQATAMAGFRRGLGLPDAVAVGDRVTMTPDGFDPIEGEVDWVSPSFLGVRADDALYRFIWIFVGGTMVGHHLFAAGADRQEALDDWRGWLDRTFG